MPPRPLDRVRAVIWPVIMVFHHRCLRLSAGGHGRDAAGPSSRAAGANVLARHGVALRVLELGVDDDLEDVPAEVSAYHIGSSAPSTRSMHRQRTTVGEALRAGEAIAEVEIAAGADLLIIGDMGIGNTTPAAVLVAATFGLQAEEARHWCGR